MIVVTAYLVLYNLAMLAGWAATLAAAAFFFYGQYPGPYQTEPLYASTAANCSCLAKYAEMARTEAHVAAPFNAFALLLTASQLAMALEPVHALLRLVNSPFITSLLQVFSRLAVVLVLAFFPETRTSFGVTLLAFAWSITEVIRYAFYAINTPGLRVPRFLKWLRYTLFFILYPTGVAGELLVLHQAAPLVATRYNVPVNALLAAIGVSYVLGFPLLFIYMVSQRRKVLYPRKAAPAKPQTPSKAKPQTPSKSPSKSPAKSPAKSPSKAESKKNL
eukprot:m51a1_g5536 putative protein tyrosine (276) ;mRNA; r:461474-462491